MPNPLYTVSDGLATLGPQAVHICERLEVQFQNWAKACGAEALRCPPLTPVSSLDRLDYFRNFPHLGSIVTQIRADFLEDYAATTRVDEVPSERLAPAAFVIPSAACYSVYLYLEGATLGRPCYFTTWARCCRNEDYYAGLERLWAFTMHEIVCVGDAAAVRTHLDQMKTRIIAFADGAGVTLESRVATDPFYEKSGPRAMMQRLAPVKEEFAFRGEVAAASVNYHRNFFGERCNIRMEDGNFAFSGCAAFGLERWLHSFLTEYGDDLTAIDRALDAGAAAIA